MEYRNLGSTGLLVSRLIFGGAHIGEIVHGEDVGTLIDAALESGINAFYTADDYNSGNSERLIGQGLKSRRDDVVIITKAGYRVADSRVPQSMGEHSATHGSGRIDHARLWRKGVAPTSRGLNRKHLTSALDASLRRLQTDYIDVYMTHFWDPVTPIEETIGTLTDFVRQGKVRYIGCSQTAPWQLVRALWTSDQRNAERYECLQVRFNLLERTPNREYAPAASAMGVSLFAFNSLAQGLLAGSFRNGSERPEGQGYRQTYMDMYWNQSTFDFLERLRELAKQTGRPMSELAQGWLLAQPAVTSLLIGPNDPGDFVPQAAAVTNPLSADEVQAIDRILAAVPEDFSGISAH